MAEVFDLKFVSLVPPCTLLLLIFVAWCVPLWSKAGVPDACGQGRGKSRSRLSICWPVDDLDAFSHCGSPGKDVAMSKSGGRISDKLGSLIFWPEYSTDVLVKSALFLMQPPKYSYCCGQELLTDAPYGQGRSPHAANYCGFQMNELLSCFRSIEHGSQAATTSTAGTTSNNETLNHSVHPYSITQGSLILR